MNLVLGIGLYAAVQGAWHATALSGSVGAYEACTRSRTRQIERCSGVGGGCASSRG